tara:strand:- start:753 stop:1094 length:342 start_codon:yes stop_codon:yes gene_type:complete
MTSYEKMIQILHNKDFELLEDWVAEDFILIFESQMHSRDDFLERVKAGLENIEKTSDYFYEEECLFANDDIMNYSRLEKQGDGVYRVVGMVLMNTEGKLWRNVERITKVEVKK